MKFRTEIKASKAGVKIDHKSKVLLFGSCFTEHIHEKLQYFGFDTLANSHGILFQPLAIEGALMDALRNTRYTEDELLLFEGLWISLNHHSQFNHSDPEQVKENINQGISKTNDYLKKASHLIITLGTSWAYRYQKQDRLVANCHKIPQKEFQKELLKAEEISSSLKRTIQALHRENPKMQIILTLSPVRHLKDGFVENSRSKALLNQAIHEVVDEKIVFYFPSYEIMMDDLRDYRFYKNDLLHPNEQAVEYIWEKFSSSWLSPQTNELVKEITQLRKSMSHRAFNPESEKHKKFEQELNTRLQDFKKKHPDVKWSNFE